MNETLNPQEAEQSSTMAQAAMPSLGEKLAAQGAQTEAVEEATAVETETKEVETEETTPEPEKVEEKANTETND